MTPPKRIQLSRAKGWRKPEGVVSVARPTKWGNPFSLLTITLAYPSLDDDGVRGMAVAQFRDLVASDGGPMTLSERRPDGKGREPVTYTYPTRAQIRAEMVGRDLACWCALNERCHADVLLEIANDGGEGVIPDG